jgi:hypothetical protein
MSKPKGFILLPVVVGLTLVAALAYYMTREGAMNVDINSSEMKIADAKNVAEAGIRYATQDLNSRGCNNYPTSYGPIKLDADRSFSVNQVGTAVTSGSGLTLSSDGTIGDTKANITSPLTPIYGEPAQSVTLNSTTGIDDTYLDGKPCCTTTPNYALTTMILSWGTNAEVRPLMKFDLSSIPKGSNIISATLKLTPISISTGSYTVNLYRMTSDWNPLTTTWNASAAGLPWTTAGGDYDGTTLEAQSTISSLAVQSFDIQSLVSKWVSGSAKNYGLILAVPPVNTNISYASSQTPASQPQLVVNFVGPRSHVFLKGASGKDTYITPGDASVSSPPLADKNFGKDAELILDNGFKVAFPLIKFDLSTIPPGAKLAYANLVMTLSTHPTAAFGNSSSNGTIPKGTAQISIHKMLQDWKEGTGTSSSMTNDGVSWNWADKTTNRIWGNPPGFNNTQPTPMLPAYPSPQVNGNIGLLPSFINSKLQPGWNGSTAAGNWKDGSQGGYYDVTYDEKYSTSPPYYVPYNLVKFFQADNLTKITNSSDTNKPQWDITSIVSDWMADPTQNHGLIIRADSELGQAKFYSFEQVSPFDRPTIEMGYYMPCNTPKPVTVSNVFSPATIQKTQTSTLIITLFNPTSSPLNIISVKDNLPLNMSLATLPSNLTSSCTGGGAAITWSNTVSSGITTFNMTGGQIPASGSCTISAIVKPNLSAITVSTPLTNTILPNDVVTNQTSAPTNPFFSSAQLTVLPSVTLNPTADTAIWKTASLATSNCGVCAELAASTPNSNQVNSLFKFDLSGIPAASTLTSVKLRLYVTQIVNRDAGQVLTLQASPVTASWVEGTDNVVSSTGGVTWKKRSTALGNWSAQGGDFSAVNAATTTIPGSFVGTLGSGMWVEFDVTVAARAMFTSPATNFGFHVQETTVLTLSNEVRLASRENTTPAGTAPQLVISYY